MTFEIFLNILLIALLTVGIVYAVVLESRLSSLRENYRKLVLLMKQFYEMTQKTQEDTIQLNNKTEKIHQQLQQDILTARQLSSFLRTAAVKSKFPTTQSFSEINSSFKAESKERSYSLAEQELLDILNSEKKE